MKYANVTSDSMVLVIDTTTGEEVKFFKADDQFAAALALVKKGDFKDVFKLEAKSVITAFFKATKDKHSLVTVSIENGIGYITLHKFGDMKVPLADVITKKIVTMSSQGFDCKPLVNFLSNLYDNPSKTAIDELYLFIEACNLPITEDGYFIAYKIVKNDYMDIYTSKVRNMIGDVPSMPRGLVDTDRNRTCSQGLHFCSKTYLNSYGSSNRSNDRCMLVKINPADVVAIPSDYNNAKGRTWVYEVVGEVASGWRNTLPTTDYTASAVVKNTGVEFTAADFEEEEEDETNEWGDGSNGQALPATPIVITPTDGACAGGYSPQFSQGYITGFTHGKHKYNQMSLVAGSEYANGYLKGYKDGKNKRKKII